MSASTQKTLPKTPRKRLSHPQFISALRGYTNPHKTRISSPEHTLGADIRASEEGLRAGLQRRGFLCPSGRSNAKQLCGAPLLRKPTLPKLQGTVIAPGIRITPGGLIVEGAFVHGQIFSPGRTSHRNIPDGWEAISYKDGISIKGAIKHDTALNIVAYNRGKLALPLPPYSKAHHRKPVPHVLER